MDRPEAKRDNPRFKRPVCLLGHGRNQTDPSCASIKRVPRERIHRHRHDEPIPTDFLASFQTASDIGMRVGFGAALQPGEGCVQEAPFPRPRCSRGKGAFKEHPHFCKDV
ncbi:hypothetical protein CgunFtcFv8_018982 [Champsocephalus gunnari]|uniref:Uncharacterized protein n=1 Tax=Champsocephalus gunnari TaxID=52237 RepID=A0AAN8DIE2_CHAGU|nr:hypothetical protein CgunFtcFv8_018982 [Champsocephalus gunnari]